MFHQTWAQSLSFAWKLLQISIQKCTIAQHSVINQLLEKKPKFSKNTEQICVILNVTWFGRLREFRGALLLNNYLSIKARSQGVTVIHFCGKWFQAFLRQFSTNHAEFLIWCRNCIKEEPLSRIFQKFQKIFRKTIYSSECNCRLMHVWVEVFLDIWKCFSENFVENSENSGKFFRIFGKIERETLLWYNFYIIFKYQQD